MMDSNVQIQKNLHQKLKHLMYKKIIYVYILKMFFNAVQLKSINL